MTTETDKLVSLGFSDRLLQWGRGLVTTETRALDTATEKTITLQWGRGLVTTETSGRWGKLGGYTPLQWGRGLVTTETARHAWRHARLSLASMGPWSGDHGNLSCPCFEVLYEGFNGAVVW